jgi:hypothetical protein
MNYDVYTCRSCGQTFDKFSVHNCPGFHPQPVKPKAREKMKKVFICSRYRADASHTIDEAVFSALRACRFAIDKGYAPIAPHLYLPRCLDDNSEIERAAGIAAGQAFLAVCDEVWQWGKTITEGMAADLALAKYLGIPIKVYNTLGIPYERWGSVLYGEEYDEAFRGHKQA